MNNMSTDMTNILCRPTREQKAQIATPRKLNIRNIKTQQIYSRLENMNPI